ncbi:GNAT family N-acetyltransferase [Burkholderia sp. Ac-20365]|uniref:GNAT family N-acetyltransferase n=1 Tax=Burkholderia sp. Ac-20365 TaxID=2703897 RepID=UPI00197B2852|nr:GNAT family N-acetyltransferase [Burkholderia sp. Ac-20365]MBN3766125.1 GNAT family N-acetyltransferase [Burkholderia sp. Ac-20365]
MTDITLVELTSRDFMQWAEHLSRQIAESGQAGSPVFAPDPEVDFLNDERKQRFEKRIALPTSGSGWMRVWAFSDTGGRLIAHVDLNSSPMRSERHRVMLGIGVEMAFHRQGLGAALLRVAIDFAAANRIEWIDLSVLGGNETAIALYRSLGFEETGRRRDRFRIGGQSIDDVMMSLRIGL